MSTMSISTTNIVKGKDDVIRRDITLHHFRDRWFSDEKNYVITREDKGLALGQWAY